MIANVVILWKALRNLNTKHWFMNNKKKGQSYLWWGCRTIWCLPVASSSEWAPPPSEPVPLDDPFPTPVVVCACGGGVDCPSPSLLNHVVLGCIPCVELCGTWEMGWMSNWPWRRCRTSSRENSSPEWGPISHEVVLAPSPCAICSRSPCTRLIGDPVMLFCR